MLESSERFSESDSLSLASFYDLISDAFTRDIPAFDPSWREQNDSLPNDREDYIGFGATLIRQIVDLREMKEAGILDEEYRYFVVNSPRNARWYNFDPFGYLECGCAGSLDGWEPDDESGRQFVPGQVAVVGEDGSIENVNPQDLHRPVVELPVVTWDQIQDFINCGRVYE